MFLEKLCYMVLLELLEDQHHHPKTSLIHEKFKKVNFGVLSGPLVGLASVNDTVCNFVCVLICDILNHYIRYKQCLMLFDFEGRRG